MNIKSLLLGSAAALAAVSGAQAADAIIAAEPEPMEYVRVCDAFGTGYFYIPGTETCLKIGGYVRFQVDFNSDGLAFAGDDDWDAFTRGRLAVTAKSDTELGELTAFMAIHGDTSERTSAAVGDDHFYFDEVYLQLGGFKAGTYLNWWDKGINGETDKLGGNRLTSIAYTYTGDAFTFGVQLDELTTEDLVVIDPVTLLPTGVTAGEQNVGIEAIISASLGAASFDLLGGYDFDAEEGAVRALVSADVGPGVLQLAGVYASDASVYYSRAEWSIAASYAFKATDRFTITPGVQYDSDYGFVDADAWRAGVTADYAITSGLSMKATVNYNDIDTDVAGASDVDFWDGFVRLERSF